MGENEQPPLLDMPRPGEFARLGITLRREVRGGHQSRVWLATLNSDAQSSDLVSPEVIIKLIDASSVDRTHALQRIELRGQLARHDDRVVPIVPLAGSIVNRIENVFVVASPRIEGRFLDVTRRSDVERMGRAMARLHQSLRLVQADLPVVHALQVAESVHALADDHQLIHGDFGPANLLLDSGGQLWVFDFDDCGYGPVEFDLGNTLFMVLFDTSTTLSKPSDEYRQFRRWLLGAYRASAQRTVQDALIDISVRARGEALRHWLSNLDEAPPGIRSASSAWHGRLRSFIGEVSL